MDTEHAQKVLDVLDLLQGSGDNNVFEKIGRLDPDRMALSFEDVDSLIISGKEWWNRNTKEIRKIVCSNNGISSLSSASSKLIIETVFPLLAIKYGEAMAVYVTALAVKKFLEGWCGMKNDV